MTPSQIRYNLSKNEDFKKERQKVLENNNCVICEKHSPDSVFRYCTIDEIIKSNEIDSLDKALYEIDLFFEDVLPVHDVCHKVEARKVRQDLFYKLDPNRSADQEDLTDDEIKTLNELASVNFEAF